MAYRKISMNRRPVGRKSNRPGKYAKRVTKGLTAFQRLFRRHLTRRRVSADKAQHAAIRGALRKGVSLRGRVMAKIRKGAYTAQWRGHRNRYSKRLRGRGSKSTARGYY